jgi:hypothetical protein
MARAKAQAAPPTVDRLREVLGSYRYTFANEKDLQDGLARVLFQRGIRFDREVRLPPLTKDDRVKDIPDFMVDGIAVEVKVDGGLSDVTRQLHRYAQRKEVRSLLLVTSRAALGNQPAEMNGKRLVVLTLWGLA